MKKVVEYKIERHIEDVVKKRKWLFFCEYEKTPVWCLVKYVRVSRVDVDRYGLPSDVEIRYEKVLLKSQDEDYIKQEFKNFTEWLK